MSTPLLQGSPVECVLGLCVEVVAIDETLVAVHVVFERSKLADMLKCRGTIHSCFALPQHNGIFFICHFLGLVDSFTSSAEDNGTWWLTAHLSLSCLSYGAWNMI